MRSNLHAGGLGQLEAEEREDDLQRAGPTVHEVAVEHVQVLVVGRPRGVQDVQQVGELAVQVAHHLTPTYMHIEVSSDFGNIAEQCGSAKIVSCSARVAHGSRSGCKGAHSDEASELTWGRSGSTRCEM